MLAGWKSKNAERILAKIPTEHVQSTLCSQQNPGKRLSHIIFALSLSFHFRRLFYSDTFFPPIFASPLNNAARFLFSFRQMYEKKE